MLEQRGCWRKEDHGAPRRRTPRALAAGAGRGRQPLRTAAAAAVAAATPSPPPPLTQPSTLPTQPTPLDYYTLLRFLRARNYDHDRAFKMWSDSLAWRKQFDVDTILDTFVFPEREQFLMAYVRAGRGGGGGRWGAGRSGVAAGGRAAAPGTPCGGSGSGVPGRQRALGNTRSRTPAPRSCCAPQPQGYHKTDKLVRGRGGQPRTRRRPQQPGSWRLAPPPRPARQPRAAPQGRSRRPACRLPPPLPHPRAAPYTSSCWARSTSASCARSRRRSAWSSSTYRWVLCLIGVP
jgi:hypothetical protein